MLRAVTFIFLAYLVITPIFFFSSLCKNDEEEASFRSFTTVNMPRRSHDSKPAEPRPARAVVRDIEPESLTMVRKSTPRLTKSSSLVLIRLVLTKIQPFKNVKINKEMYGRQRTYGHTFLCKF